MLKKLTNKNVKRFKVERTAHIDECFIECRIVCNHESVLTGTVTTSMRY
jgi:hypothetical protein